MAHRRITCHRALPQHCLPGVRLAAALVVRQRQAERYASGRRRWARAAAGGGAPPAGGRGFGAAPYRQAGPFKTLRPADVVGTWMTSVGLGMNRQLFTFLSVGDQLRGVVCGRCDNPYTMAAIEHITIIGDKLYFDIVHEDWGEIDSANV